MKFQLKSLNSNISTFVRYEILEKMSFALSTRNLAPEPHRVRGCTATNIYLFTTDALELFL